MSKKDIEGDKLQKVRQLQEIPKKGSFEPNSGQKFCFIKQLCLTGICQFKSVLVRNVLCSSKCNNAPSWDMILEFIVKKWEINPT